MLHVHICLCGSVTADSWMRVVGKTLPGAPGLGLLHKTASYSGFVCVPRWQQTGSEITVTIVESFDTDAVPR